MSRQPFDIDAEKQVLGAVLVSPSRFAEVAPEIEPWDWYHPAHAAIWEAMTELDRASSPVDTLSVVEWLRIQGLLEQLNSVGGEGCLIDLQARVVTVGNLAYHARAIAKKAERRRWLVAAAKLQEAALSGGDDAEFVQRAERTAMELMTRRRAGGPVHLSRSCARCKRHLRHAGIAGTTAV
jgi:replicative DNA helicase